MERVMGLELKTSEGKKRGKKTKLWWRVTFTQDSGAPRSQRRQRAGLGTATDSGQGLDESAQQHRFLRAAGLRPGMLLGKALRRSRMTVSIREGTAPLRMAAPSPTTALVYFQNVRVRLQEVQAVITEETARIMRAV
ncbi:epidermal growth factor receptor substrate 15 [Platysternon megacephalum]|uniref:Epidermal growth factor receptor substrate 15 n=1 Tax=Platysternon megacephalum TaxID=55544 RepID=A0A4D9EXZ7_9SAUR|nr:epidermal growth factor receptor substrate 15 [Platysternon megacephalum]